MGRKVHPYGFRLGVIRDWKSKWFAPKREYTQLVREDFELRSYLKRQMDKAGVGDVVIERFPPNQLHVTVHTARPGIVIGRKGAAVKGIREGIERLTGKRVKLDIEEISKPELSAALVAENIAQQIQRRIPYNRAMKKAAQATMQKGALGVRIECAGRLNGSEMKRTDKIMEGRIPRQTLRADIDFARDEALTTYGQIGVKVWIYKGDVLPELQAEEQQTTRSSRQGREGREGRDGRNGREGREGRDGRETREARSEGQG